MHQETDQHWMSTLANNQMLLSYIKSNRGIDMKKRKIVISVIILLVIGIPCLINMSNFYLGSNSMFYRTVLDYPDTVWVCNEPKARITVTIKHVEESWGAKALLEAENEGQKSRFSVETQANRFDLFRLDENGNEISNVINDPNGNVISARAKYRKNIWGEVTSFQITVINDNQTIAGYKTLEFYKQG